MTRRRLVGPAIAVGVLALGAAIVFALPRLPERGKTVARIDCGFAWVPGYADYRTPVRGLYLCGAATHPGGGVMGACGYNAAREILKDR